MTNYQNRRITKQNLSEQFSISLTTTRRTLKAIGADLSHRIYDAETLERFAFARQLFQQGWNQEQITTFFKFRNTTRNISNQ